MSNSAQTEAEHEPSAGPGVQDSLQELSALYEICQEIGKEVPLDRTLRRITGLVAQGMRWSSMVIAEIWLDGVRHSAFPEFQEKEAEISAPIWVAKDVRGKLSVYTCHRAAFDPSESVFLTNVARKIGYMVRRAELRRALYESESKHRRLVEAISEGIFWAEAAGGGIPWSGGAGRDRVVERCLRDMRVTDCNLRFAAFHGYPSVEACIGTRVSELFANEPAARDYFDAILDRGRVVSVVERGDGDGFPRRIEMDSHLIRRGSQIIGLQGINIDRGAAATSQSARAAVSTPAAESVEQKLTLFRAAIERCEYCVVLADLDGAIIYANSAQAQLLGRSQDELIGTNVNLFEMPGQEQIERDMEWATFSRGMWSGELLRQRADGELVPVRMMTSLIRDEGGRPIAQLRIASDITEQKRLQTQFEEQSEHLQRMVEQRTRRLMQSERNYRFLYEHAPIGTLMTTFTGVILDANPAACALLKRSREQLLQENLALLLGIPQRYQALMRQLFIGKPVVDEEMQYSGVGAKPVLFEHSCVFVDWPNIGPQVIHFLRDITQARKLAEEAEKGRQQVMRAERLAALGQLVAGVAHELNNPLTAVLTYANLLQKKLNADTEQSRQLGLIVEAGERCRQIVRDLLDFAREERPAKAMVNPNDLVEHVIAMMRNQILISKITLDRRLDPDLPTVWADRHEIEQVLLNICINGIEAMAEGGRLTVGSRYEADTDRVVLTITDSGSGIAPENLEKVFDPFFTTKPPGKGTGLGLAVSQRIVSDHAGQLTVNSELGEGSTFTLELPRSDATPVEPSETEA